jgi:hypothetical protein
MNKLQLTLAALAAAGTLSLSTMAPAYADGAASTRTIILGAAAIAGLAIEANVANKHARANSISGYLPDGSAVYGDGHVVAPNGDSYYPANNGQTVSCDDGSCSIAYVGAAPVAYVSGDNSGTGDEGSARFVPANTRQNANGPSNGRRWTSDASRQ